MKKIGIIGSGIVGRTLAAGFCKHGYQVKIGSRNPEKLEEWYQEQSFEHLTLGTFSEASFFGEILVLAVKGRHAIHALELCKVEHINQKLIIDTTNPIDDEQGPEEGVLNFFTDQNYSLMEQLQDRFPDAFLVKAFSCIGAAWMVDPEFGDLKPTMFMAGNDAGSKKEVKQILDKFGWEASDMGKAQAARAIEPLCRLWCIPGFLHQQWSHAFKLLLK